MSYRITTTTPISQAADLMIQRFGKRAERECLNRAYATAHPYCHDFWLAVGCKVRRLLQEARRPS